MRARDGEEETLVFGREVDEGEGALIERLLCTGQVQGPGVCHCGVARVGRPDRPDQLALLFSQTHDPTAQRCGLQLLLFLALATLADSRELAVHALALLVDPPL